MGHTDYTGQYNMFNFDLNRMTVGCVLQMT